MVLRDVLASGEVLILAAALLGLVLAQILPEPPSNPNLAYSSLICGSSQRTKEANIWIGVSKTDPENVRFVTECLPCLVMGACQSLSVSNSLDRVNYNWQRVNAGCFQGLVVDENVSLVQVKPRIRVVENGGGCSTP